MAAVLDALVPLVINTIKDMTEEELRTALGVSTEIKKLQGKVENIKAYVSDAERRRINEARVQGWVSKLKDALYEATDILELCQLDADERRHKGKGCWDRTEEKAPGCLLPLLFCLRKPAFARDMGGRIKELNERLDGISKEMSQFGFEPLGSFPERTRPSDATPHSRTTTSLIDESDIVGDKIEEDTRTLAQAVLSNGEPATIKVVSIVGEGGIGKTTLAKKVFNDDDVQATFGSKVWLSVTESYDEEKLLSSAITQAGDGQASGGGDKEVLTRALAGALSSRGRKFLLVLDDVWSIEPWIGVLKSAAMEAARKHPGSRVIITTRNEELVKDMGAVYYQHSVKPMDDEDAWSLLKKQLPPQDVGSDDDLEHLRDIGMKIVKNCAGLPLAVKAIGGLLRTKRATESEWKNVLHDPAWKTDKTHHDLNIALQLSYEDLPPALKQCFLYCSLIPKGIDLTYNDIIGMWMSEGFLSVAGRHEEEEYNLGRSYYKSLVTRNLIEAGEIYTNKEICIMHDVIRTFAQYLANEEMLVIKPSPTSWQQLHSSKKLRHLTVESTTDESGSAVLLPEWNSILGKQELLRSLIINGRMKFEPSTEDSSSLDKQFPRLRMLFMRHVESNRFAESLSKLKHLRFLWLESTDISSLPHDIDKMKFLEFISIRGCDKFSGELPSSIIKLERLRHVILGETKFTVPKGFGGLTNLRTLSIFPVQTDGEWCSLQELGPLSRLRSLMIQGLEEVSSGSSAATKAKIHEKEDLRLLILSCNNLEEKSNTDNKAVVQDKAEEVFDELRPPRHLQTLALHNYFGRRAPSWLMATAVDLNSLTGLMMTSLSFCTQLPDGLCHLHSLEKLIIELAPAIKCVGHEFTAGGGRFPRLQLLMLHEMSNWERWQWEEEDGTIAMPMLHELFIRGCNKLDHLPAGLASSKRIALKVLHLTDATRIEAVENFPSVEKLVVSRCPNLKVIRGFTRMQVIVVRSCPALKALKAIPALHTMDLHDPEMVILPEYLKGLKLKLLRVTCHERLINVFLFINHKPSTFEDLFEHMCLKMLTPKWWKHVFEDCEKVVFSFTPSSDTTHQQEALQMMQPGMVPGAGHYMSQVPMFPPRTPLTPQQMQEQQQLQQLGMKTDGKNPVSVRPFFHIYSIF